MSATDGTLRHRSRHAVRLLLAEADSDTRQMYRESLQSVASDVVDAVDGREALVRAFVHRPSLVITDTRLPFLDGYELLALLRHDAATRDVPVLVITSESRHGELTRAWQSGADSVLVKPVTPDVLLLEVQRLLSKASEDESSSNPSRSEKARPTVLTSTPPAVPPPLLCPDCDRPLTYVHSHVAGVRTSAEQWDAFTCPTCGAFEYRPRTRKLRRCV